MTDLIRLDGTTIPTLDTASDTTFDTGSDTTFDTASDTGLGALDEIVQQVRADVVWTTGFTGAGVNVAVIDTGITAVPALGDAKIVASIDFSAEHDDPLASGRDTYGHGTHLAGIVAAASSTTRGVAPGAGLVAVKVAGRDGAVSLTNLIAGVEWVVENSATLGIGVLLLAFNTEALTGYRDDPLAEALERAWQAGVVVVTAAGNRGASGGLGAPAHDPTLIAVGATEATPDGMIVPEWTSRGDGRRNPDLAAPGAHVASLRVPGSQADTEHPEGYVDADHFLGSGSSQAAAVVAGVAALVRSARPGWNPDQVKRALVAGSRDLGLDERAVGAGLVDAAAALAARPSAAPQPFAPARAAAIVAPVVSTVDFLTQGVSWTGVSWTGQTWTGQTWTGQTWTGQTWTGQTWTGQTWTGQTWTGQTWTGQTWTGQTWTGQTWTGQTWTGQTWTGQTWTGQTWTGQTWTGVSWTGQTWT